MTAPTITVYTKTLTVCRQCDATKRALDKKGITYDEVSIDTDPAVAEKLAAAGFRQAPVVRVDYPDTGEHDAWSGYDPARIKELAS